MSQLQSSPSETFSSGVFQLPPEILVYIAKYLLAAESKTKYEFSAFQRPKEIGMFVRAGADHFATGEHDIVRQSVIAH